MKVSNLIDVAGNAMMYALSVAQTKEVFQIISLVLSILISVVILVRNIIQWWKNAKKDGKIDADEIDNLVDIIQTGAEEMKDQVEDKNKEE